MTPSRSSRLLHRRKTYGELVMAALSRRPESVAFVFDGRSITYRETASTILRMASVLAGRGVRKGTGVAVLSRNRPEAWCATIAAQLIGGRTSALHSSGSLEDHQFICQDAQIHTVIFDPDPYEHHVEQLTGQPALRNALALGSAPGFDDLLSLAGSAAEWAGRQPVAEKDVASLVYTGGTTGRPKGVIRPHRCLAEMVQLHLAEWPWPREPRFLACAPMTHATGMMMVPILLRGGTVFVHQRFDPAHWLETVEREQINSSFLVPTMLYRILDDPGASSARLESLETVYYGAAPISPDRLAAAIDVFGPVFTQFYAQAESTVIGTILGHEDHDRRSPARLASAGRPLASARVELLDEEGRPVDVGQMGEICMRGPFVMDGYWNQPEITAETLRGGWLHTGDLATKDHDGYITIVGRNKDMIISGGFNVFAREIEDVLVTHPDIAQAAVIGVPDPDWGEAVMAVVVPRSGRDPDTDEILALVRRRKGAVHVPKVLRFADAVPLTPLGKIDKKAIRASYWPVDGRQVH